jgi:hypothetical protein
MFRSVSHHLFVMSDFALSLRRLLRLCRKEVTFAALAASASVEPEDPRTIDEQILELLQRAQLLPAAVLLMGFKHLLRYEDSESRLLPVVLPLLPTLMRCPIIRSTVIILFSFVSFSAFTTMADRAAQADLLVAFEQLILYNLRPQRDTVVGLLRQEIANKTLPEDARLHAVFLLLSLQKDSEAECKEYLKDMPSYPYPGTSSSLNNAIAEILLRVLSPCACPNILR